MRRKDREITDPAIMHDIMKKADVLHLAMCEDSKPYVVAMNFGYEPGILYFHSALEGRKVDLLRKNKQVAFFVETDHELVTGKQACDCGMHYRSVYGEGRAFLVEDEAERKKGLDCIMRKYSSDTEFTYDVHVMKRTLVIRVDIDVMTGKRS